MLIAEDYEDTRELYAAGLSDAGFTVITARDGAEAVDAVASQRVEAIVIDLKMPVMTGWEAIRRIREIHGTAAYILAVSAHGFESSRSDAYEAGVDDFVTKPVTADVIVTIVRAALRSRPRAA